MEKKSKVIKQTSSERNQDTIGSVSEGKLSKKYLDKMSSKDLNNLKSKSSNSSTKKSSVVKDVSVESSIKKVRNISSKSIPGTSKTSTTIRETNKTSLVIQKTSNVNISNTSLGGNIQLLKNASGPASKYSKRRENSQPKANVKQKLTNVTVRSPTRERDKGKMIANHDIRTNLKGHIKSIHSDQNSDIDLVLPRSHKRYQTRTLDPSEVKVLKPDNNPALDKDMEQLTKVTQQSAVLSVAKAEAFYVPLEEKFTIPEKVPKTSNVDTDSDPTSYEEDFESYESDFESFKSSDEKSEAVEGSDEDADTKQIASSHDIKSNDETHLDSGNYDMKINLDLKSKEAKNILSIDNVSNEFIKSRDVDSAKMLSYSDEGFDENSVGFSSTSNPGNLKHDDIAASIKDDDSVLYGLNYKQKYKRKNYYKQRAQDLYSLITFDNIEYSLFEISPIPYDIFIKTFGKSNVIQRSTQTNDDYVEDFVQTDIILKENKWCQFPVDYSNFDIVTKNAIDSYKKPNTLVNVSLEENSYNKSNTIVEIVPIQNSLQIYRSQRLGCNTDTTSFEHSSNIPTFISDQKQYDKLHNFIGKVGKFMIRYLNETSSNLETNTQKVKSDFKFSDEYTKPLSKTFNNKECLRNRPPTMISVDSNNIDIMLTFHPKAVNRGNADDIQDKIFSRALLCIWQNPISINDQPIKLLLCVDNITICKIYDGTNGFVVAGSNDGTIFAWDLEEHNMWHTSIKSNIAEQRLNRKNIEISGGDLEVDKVIDNLVLRCCSFTSLTIDSDHPDSFHGPVVDISIIHHYETNSRQKDNNYNQVCVLQEHGFLTIWAVIKTNSMRRKFAFGAINEINQSYWTNMKLHKHMVINIQQNFNHISILNSSAMEKKFIKKSLSLNEFPLTNVKRKNSYKRAITPRSSNETQDETLTKRKNESPFQSLPDTNDSLIGWESKISCSVLEYMYDTDSIGHLLVSCASGRIMHFDQRGNLLNPQVFTSSGSTSQIKSIEICHHNLSYFLVGCDNSIDLFSISNPKPLKSFYSEKSLDYSERYFGELLTCIEWSKLRPCLFFTLSNKGCLTVWDLLKSDLVPIISEILSRGNDVVQRLKLLLDEKQTPNREYLVLFYTSGDVEMHSVSKDLTKSIHQDKQIETKVLERYMQLL